MVAAAVTLTGLGFLEAPGETGDVFGTVSAVDRPAATVSAVDREAG